MLLNYILMKNSYPPVIIHKKLREFYLDVLREADASAPAKAELKHYKELAQYVADELAGTYWNVFLV